LSKETAERMHKLTRKRTFLLLAFALIVIICLAVWYFYNSLLWKPEWYKQSNSNNTEPDSVLLHDLSNRNSLVTTAGTLQINTKNNYAAVFPVSRQTKKIEEKEMSVEEFSDFLYTIIQQWLREINQNPDILKGFKLELDGESVKTGLVVSLNAVNVDLLYPADREAFIQAKKILPFLFTNEIYFELNGKHRVRNFRLYLDPESRVKIGKLDFSLLQLKKLLKVESTFPDVFYLMPVGNMQFMDIIPRQNRIFVRSRHIKNQPFPKILRLINYSM